MLKKFLLFVLIGFGLVWVYFWYVRGINLLLSEADPTTLPPYNTFAVRIPEKIPKTAHWELAAPMLTERTRVAAAALNDVIYVVGGVDAFGKSMDAVEVFYADKNSWMSVAPLPKPLYGVALTSYEGRLYAIGGLSGLTEKPSDSLFIYDPKADRWSKGKNLPQPVGAASALVLDKSIRVFGGFGQGQSQDTQYVYDPAKNEWTSGEPLISGRDHAAAVAFGGAAYLFGGRQGGILYNIADTSMYIPGSDSWDDLVRMPIKRASGAAALLNGKAYLFCGEGPTATVNEVDVFDLASKSWTKTVDMPTARQGCGAAAVNGRIFVIGGGRKPGLSVSDLNEVFVP